MPESIESIASKQLKERMDDAIKLMRQRYKGKAPLGQEPKSMDEQLTEYDNLNPEALEDMLEKFGSDKVKKWTEKMEAEKTRRLYGN